MERNEDTRGVPKSPRPMPMPKVKPPKKETEQQQINEKPDMLFFAETMATLESQWRVKTYMNLLLRMRLDPKRNGHDHVIRILKEVVLGHTNVLGDVDDRL